MYTSPDGFLGYIYGTTDTTTMAYYLKLKEALATILTKNIICFGNW
jgi:hypothetical protein